MDQLFKYCQLCKRDVSSPALTMKRLNDGRGCPVTGICTRTLLQPALNLVSSFRFKTPDFAPPRRAWAVLLGGNPKAFLDLESLLHRSCTHPALPRPAQCPSWLLQVSGQTPNFGSSSMPGEACAERRKCDTPCLPSLPRLTFLPKACFPTWIAARLTSNTTPSKNHAVQTEKSSALP